MDDVKKPTTCDTCGGSGIIEVPSMLGFGTEVYPCGKCHALSDEVAKATTDATHAWIMSNIK